MGCRCKHHVPPRPAPRPPLVPFPPFMHQTPTYVGPGCCCWPLPPHYWHPFMYGPCGCFPHFPPHGPSQYTPSHLYPNFFNVCGWPRFIPPFPIFMPNQPVPRPFTPCIPFDPRLRW